MVLLIRLIGAPHACTSFERTAGDLLKEFGFATSQSAGEFVVVLGNDPDRAAKAAETQPASLVAWVPLAATAGEGLSLLQRAPGGAVATFALGEAGMKNAVLHFVSIRAARGEAKAVALLDSFRTRQTETVLSAKLEG